MTHHLATAGSVYKINQDLKPGYYNLCWNFRTIYGGKEQSRNRVVVPARKATQAGGNDSMESILGLLRHT